MGAVKYPEPLVFGLDIGTRSIVGTVGYKDRDKFNVVAMVERFHDTRAMVDGQIHDIAKISEEILEVKKALEEKLNGRKLTDVCIAAAGRVLKTAVGHGDYEFNENTVITQEYIHSIDLIGVEKAHNIIVDELNSLNETTKYYCVGYTVIKYYLNDYEIINLEGHKGTRIGADVLATFLPEEVVSSLYSAVEQAGLMVSNLTLEPIAAINVAIPEQYRLLNIALIDVGAGTSDICITKDGSIIGYGMIPSAGDEMTEILLKKYLVDFKTAEKLKLSSTKKKPITYKDIMGISHKITPEEISTTLDEVRAEITKKIADKIIELNGGIPVSAAFVVGGGGKVDGFTKHIADALDIPEERVAIRGAEVMNDINFMIEDIKKDSLYVTPIGICLSYFDQKNNFIFATVNDTRVKIYNNNRLTIFDAAVQYGLPNEAIFPKRGADITYKINGKTRIVRGMDGEAAIIRQNGKIVGLNALLEANDKIEINESTAGPDASIELGSIPEYSGTLSFVVNGMNVTCPKFAIVNGNPETQFYNVCDGDEIEMQTYYTLEQLLTFMDVIPSGNVYVNNKIASSNEKVYDNFEIAWSDNIRYKDLSRQSEKNEDDLSTKNLEDVDIKTSETNIDINSQKKLKEHISENNNENYKVKESEKDNVDNNSSKEESVENKIHSIYVIVNNKKVVLSGKSEYRFVDIFDFYDFDLTTLGGDKLITNINGEHAEFVDVIKNKDVIDLYWE